MVSQAFSFRSRYASFPLPRSMESLNRFALEITELCFSRFLPWEQTREISFPITLNLSRSRTSIIETNEIVRSKHRYPFLFFFIFTKLNSKRSYNNNNNNLLISPRKRNTRLVHQIRIKRVNSKVGVYLTDGSPKANIRRRSSHLYRDNLLTRGIKDWRGKRKKEKKILNGTREIQLR